MKTRYLLILFALGLGLALVCVLGGGSSPAVAGPSAEDHIEAPSAPAAELHVCSSGCTYSSIQDAVDAANDGDVIKVAAGTYTDVNNRGGLAQVVYISKTVTIRGGYTADNWTTSDPENNPTTLDAGGQGRVLYVTDPSTGSGQAISPTVEGLHITGGDAAGLGGNLPGGDAGGGVYVISATATFSNNQVFSNTANEGGGLWLVSSDATLNGNTISFNTATASYGGGLFLSYSNATLSGNTVTSNTASGGGGLCLSWSKATLIGNTVTSNTAAIGGGLFLNYWGSDPYHYAAMFIDNIISFNVAGEGGGLALWGYSATFNGNTISGSTANEGGGLFLKQSSTTFNDNTITSNTADWGGGGLFLYWSNATLSGNTISDNSVSRGGGGGLTLHEKGTATLMGNTIFSNTALYGGGLALYKGDVTLSGNTIFSNTVSSNGGGLYLSRSDATLTNTVIADNQAGNGGGGLYVRGSSLRLLHTTIARNGSALGEATRTAGAGGDGSGVYVTDSYGIVSSTVALTNTILVSHLVGISMTEGNTVTINGVLWHDTPITISQPVTALVTVQNQHTGDPAFVDPEDGDYHIGLGSAAIDAGVDAGVDHDIDGDPRPLGSGYDLGADEVSLFVIKRAYPDPVRPGAPLTYTIRATNATGDPLHATVTDTLPLSVTLEEASGGTLALPGGTVVLPDGRVAVVWTDVITAPGGLWMGTIVVTVDEGYSGPLTNVVQVTTEEGATGVYIETAIVLRPVYLPLVLKSAGTTTVEGEYLLVGDPCTTDPCLPGMVYAVLVDHTYYYPTVEGAWLWRSRSWDGYKPEKGDFVTVTGYVHEKTDTFGNPFYNIEVASLKSALPPPTTTENVAITDVQAFGTGSQDPDEYVEIRSDNAQPVQLNGWTLHNAENDRVFTFPGHLMQPGQVCRVYTNEDHPEWCEFSYTSESDVWRYANGCAYLRDSVGTLVDAYCYCQSHTAYMTLSATTTTLQVGEVVTATVTLFNRGCTSLGLPQYRLYVRSDEPEPIFSPSNPGPVRHSLGVAPGQSDGTEFTLQAIEPGQATLNASASFEVHLGYPGPAYWGYSGIGPLTVTVMSTDRANLREMRPGWQ